MLDRPHLKEVAEKRSYGIPPGCDAIWGLDEEYSDMHEKHGDLTLRGDAELSRKHRELFVTGWAAIMNREQICTYHMRDAIEHGASLEEIVQTIQVAVFVGGAPSNTTAGHAIENLRESGELPEPKE